MTAGRSAACWGQRRRIPSEGQRRRHSPQPTAQQGAGRPLRGRCCDRQRRPGTGGGERVTEPPQWPSCPALPCPAMGAFFSTTQPLVGHCLKAVPLSPSSDAAPLGSEALLTEAAPWVPVTAVVAVTVWFLLLLLHPSPCSRRSAAWPVPLAFLLWAHGGCLRGFSSPAHGAGSSHGAG